MNTLVAAALVCQIHIGGSPMIQFERIQKAQRECLAEIAACMRGRFDMFAECLRPKGKTK